MSYKIIDESTTLYSFADEKTRTSVFDATVLKGEVTDYSFNETLLIKKDDDSSDEKPEAFIKCWL